MLLGIFPFITFKVINVLSDILSITKYITSLYILTSIPYLYACNVVSHVSQFTIVFAFILLIFVRAFFYLAFDLHINKKTTYRECKI